MRENQMGVRVCTFADDVPNTIGTSIAGRSAAPANDEGSVPHCEPTLVAVRLEPLVVGAGQLIERP